MLTPERLNEMRLRAEVLRAAGLPAPSDVVAELCDDILFLAKAITGARTALLDRAMQHALGGQL